MLAIHTSAGPRTLRLGGGLPRQGDAEPARRAGVDPRPGRAPRSAERHAASPRHRLSASCGRNGASLASWLCASKGVEVTPLVLGRRRDNKSHVDGLSPLRSRERPLALPLDRGRGVAFFAARETVAGPARRAAGPGAEVPANPLGTPRSPRPNDAGRDALSAQAAGQRDLSRRRAAAVGARRLQHARQSVETRLGEEDGAAAAAELALADVGVAIAVGAQRRLGVVEVQRAEALERPPRASQSSSTCGQALVGADVVARGEQVAGVQADAEALGAAGGVDQVGELLERAPERARRRPRCSRGAAGSARSRSAPRR